MVESEVFLWNQGIIHLYQWGEWVYDAQLWKEKRLLCESVFVQIDRRTLILKTVERWAFFMKPKHQCYLSQLVEWVYGARTWKERRLLCEFVFVSIDKRTFILKMVKRKAFFMKQKRQYHLS